MPRIPKKLRAKYKLNHCLIIRDKLKVSILFFLTTSPNSLARVLIITFYTYDHSTYRLAMLVNRRSRKHRSSVHFRKLLRYRGNKETWYTAFPNIPLSSWWFFHLFLECRTFVFRMHIFGTILTKTAHNLVLKHREWRLTELPIQLLPWNNDYLILDLF